MRFSTCFVLKRLPQHSSDENHWQIFIGIQDLAVFRAEDQGRVVISAATLGPNLETNTVEVSAAGT